MREFMGKLFDPNAQPSLTSIMSFASVFSGLIIGFIGAFMGKTEVVSYCQFLVGGGMTAKILQFGSNIVGGKK